MAISVLTPAAVSNLITLDRVKLRLGLTDSASDALLMDFISSASSAIFTYLGFHLGRQSYLETLRGNDRPRLYLAMYPVEPESVALTQGEDMIAGAVVTAGNGELYRSCGWPSWGLAFSASYRAGFLLPGEVSSWAPDTEVSAGSWVRSSAPSNLRYECISPGVTGSVEPLWPEPGDSADDGSATLVARTAWELPDAFADHVFLEVMTRFRRRDMPGGVASLNAEGFSVSFFASQTAGELLPSTQSFLDRWRIGRGGVA